MKKRQMPFLEIIIFLVQRHFFINSSERPKYLKFYTQPTFFILTHEYCVYPYFQSLTLTEISSLELGPYLSMNFEPNQFLAFLGMQRVSKPQILKPQGSHLACIAKWGYFCGPIPGPKWPFQVHWYLKG